MPTEPETTTTETTTAPEETSTVSNLYTDVKQALTDFFSNDRRIMEDEHEKKNVVDALGEFYSNYVVETVHGSIQVFTSFTYGEMVISFLLFLILLTMVFKWFWEVLR